MFNNEIYNNGGRPRSIMFFGEMAGFKIASFIAMHVKMIFFSHGAIKKKKKKSANQNSPVCMKTADIKLYTRKRNLVYGFCTVVLLRSLWHDIAL